MHFDGLPSRRARLDCAGYVNAMPLPEAHGEEPVRPPPIGESFLDRQAFDVKYHKSTTLQVYNLNYIITAWTSMKYDKLRVAKPSNATLKVIRPYLTWQNSAGETSSVKRSRDCGHRPELVLAFRTARHDYAPTLHQGRSFINERREVVSVGVRRATAIFGGFLRPLREKGPFTSIAIDSAPQWGYGGIGMVLNSFDSQGGEPPLSILNRTVFGSSDSNGTEKSGLDGVQRFMDAIVQAGRVGL